MSGHPDRSEHTRRDWDTYWRNAGPAPALRNGGPQEEVLQRFWSDLLDAALARDGDSRSLLDVGAGNGAVVRVALQSAARVRPDAPLVVSALDGSFTAL